MKNCFATMAEACLVKVEEKEEAALASDETKDDEVAEGELGEG